MQGKEQYIRRHSRGGFSLLESVLALAVGALVLISLTTAFKIARRSWTDNSEKSEVIQHGRVGMDRIMYDLKYADSVMMAMSGSIEFTTTNLIDSNPDTELIHYQLTGPTLERYVDGGTPYVVAGDQASTSNVAVTSFENTPLKLDASDNLVPLSGGDPLSLAVAIRVDLTLQGQNVNPITFSSTAKLRNK